ncbi:hypothetical protein F1642_02485 [Paracoccus sp. NBH48]|uniref:hypothetical protein n=1 Tax=Paracoccus sp. NBH48 TaxID=2596918 RepID=UPI001891BF57|nr:hypothetical protein [Paracoccus sp. NBH48]MBF5078129.1 hypothetical protein [Paracoccus sp. NBH48]
MRPISAPMRAVAPRGARPVRQQRQRHDGRNVERRDQERKGHGQVAKRLPAQALGRDRQDQQRIEPQRALEQRAAARPGLIPAHGPDQRQRPGHRKGQRHRAQIGAKPPQGQL